MPTKREREYYRMGFKDGQESARYEVATEQFGERIVGPTPPTRYSRMFIPEHPIAKKGFIKKRKLSAWNKYVKANSKKPRFRYRNGKLNLKKMAVAFRKTPAGKKKRR